MTYENCARHETERSRPCVLVTGVGSGRGNNLVRSLRARATTSTSLVATAICSCLPNQTRTGATMCRLHHLGIVSLPLPADHRGSAIDLVIPSSDDDALALARIRAQLPCRVYLPPAEVIALCQDKYALSQV